MAKVEVEWDESGWDDIAKEVILTSGVPRMQRVADACNAADITEGVGYQVSVEGIESKELGQRDYRVTVITATNQAMKHNAEENTLVKNFYLAAGDD
jgi:hypothetical protein